MVSCHVKISINHGRTEAFDNNTGELMYFPVVLEELSVVQFAD